MTILFSTGKIVATPGALDLVAEFNINLLDYLFRHLTGDWGDIPEEDKKENVYSLDVGLRLFSSYNTPGGKLWIITEADRSVTTFLIPEEY